MVVVARQKLAGIPAAARPLSSRWWVVFKSACLLAWVEEGLPLRQTVLAYRLCEQVSRHHLLKIFRAATVWADVQCSHSVAITLVALSKGVVFIWIISSARTIWTGDVNIGSTTMA